MPLGRPHQVRSLHLGSFSLRGGGGSSFQPGFAHRKRKGVGRRDEEKERKKKTEKRTKKTAKEPPALADITEEKEEEQKHVGEGAGVFSDDEDLFGQLD